MAYLCRASYLSESYSSDTRDGSNFSRLTSHQSPKRPSHRSRKHPHQRSLLDFEKESKEAYRGRGTGTRRSTTAAESSRLAACPNSRASLRAASSSARSSPSPPDSFASVLVSFELDRVGKQQSVPRTDPSPLRAKRTRAGRDDPGGTASSASASPSPSAST